MIAPEGIVLVDKPGGITSHDVVDELRRSLGTRKVGHAGTLDPMATGLLVIGVGRATRLLRYLSGMDKAYEGDALLGVTTDTLDADGQVVATADASGVSSAGIVTAAASLTGAITQIPPVFSAIKVDGEPLYRSARRGEAKEAPERAVQVTRFDVDATAPPQIGFLVECSSGTYIRTLVADLGQILGCGAHLTRLRRTRVGPFDVQDAVDATTPGEPLPIGYAVAHLPRFDVDANEAEAARHGRALVPTELEGPFGVYDPGGQLVAIYRDEGTKSVPEMVLAPGQEE